MTDEPPSPRHQRSGPDQKSGPVDAMSQIWRAAGIAGDRMEGSSNRYIKRDSKAPPLHSLNAGRFPERQSIGRGRIVVGVLIVGALFAGGLAVGRYVLPKSGSAVVSPQVRAATVFAQALNHQKAGQLSAAEKGFLQTLKIDPLNYAAYYDLGVIYGNSNRANDAILAYEKVLIINSKFQPALFNLAILESTSDPNTAISLFKRIQQLGAQQPAFVAFNLGLVYREIGKVADGNAQLRYAISLDSSLASKVPAQYLPIGPSTSTTPHS
jgi:tetratricopeptide (TPR) repeat protein